jgi:hypothetical protein
LVRPRHHVAAALPVVLIEFLTAEHNRLGPLLLLLASGLLQRCSCSTLQRGSRPTATSGFFLPRNFLYHWVRRLRCRLVKSGESVCVLEGEPEKREKHAVCPLKMQRNGPVHAARFVFRHRWTLSSVPADLYATAR